MVDKKKKKKKKKKKAPQLNWQGDLTSVRGLGAS